jgi:hypothetical protein
MTPNVREKFQVPITAIMNECSDRSLRVSPYSESVTLNLVDIILFCDYLSRAVPVTSLHINESNHVGRQIAVLFLLSSLP